jgi:uncharacterized DUF497 family protein
LYVQVRFEWDEAKARANLAKHGVAFEDAKLVWEDPFHTLVFDRVEGGEERWQAVGVVGAVALLLVVHVYPSASDEQTVRIVSARKATKHERRRYEEDRP